MKTDYEKQATDFLVKTGTKCSIKYLCYGKHFADDKECRDIYRITLKRNGKQYRFNFGQSINNSDGGKTPPTAYDVLACITKYDPGTFENFCGEFGYNTDSRTAEKTYNAVKDEYANLKILFTDDELDLMQEIQ